MTIEEKLNLVIKGFSNLHVEQKYKDSALKHIEHWLTNEDFIDYQPQIDYLIESEKWDLLLDAFYQIIPFGTGGRRGPVGVGPNRINVWTIQASAQGHSQYLLKQFGEEAKERGIVISYDVRAYLKEGEYDDKRPNPVKGLSCKDLAKKASEVYSANGIKVFLFSDYTPTPELSFMVRNLNAVSGNMISASHNPPEHNGQKVFNDTGGQLIPPYDQELVDTVVNEVREIKSMDFQEAIDKRLVVYVSEKDHRKYLDAVKEISLNHKYRGIKIFYSPFHGTAYKIIPQVFRELGFHVTSDNISSEPDPRFSSITFNIPNPEVQESFLNLVPSADGSESDIILASDPDADRIGIMSKEKDNWKFYNGNEIGVLITDYLLSELKANNKLKPTNILLKTVVTTNLITVLAERYGVKITGDLLVGFKYIGEIMDNLQVSGKISDFLLGVEESHGYTAGNYIREKDALVAGILLSELASKLKGEGKTLAQYLDQIYEENGYFLNYLTEIRLPGAEGMSSIAKIQNNLREERPIKIGEFEVEKLTDRWDGEDFVSATDKESRNVLIINFKTDENYHQLQAIVRPSGTEPKLKTYFEIGVKANPDKSLEELKAMAEEMRERLEKAVLKYCYKIIGIDFPDRGFLLFWQLPAWDKLKYFEVEPKIAELKSIQDPFRRKAELDKLLTFLGADPVKKIDKAFIAKYQTGVIDYLDLS
ncbi:MAG TPA: phospho-sugar mutase [Candidatus Dojkabacteria bacterium]|nr:phospho-sugar mutase [Candidatus Dojkabacteria bacterium]HRP51755.1 phospho-sugar mutase [Candidatus Dojkabacteria bacterium]